MSLILAVLPILLILLAGYALAASGAIPRDRWDGVNQLNFKLLIPSMMLHAIARSNLREIASGGWLWAILIVFFLQAGLVLGLRPLLGMARLPNPQFGSVFQGVTRWNGFVAVAAAAQFLGTPGLALMAIVLAVLAPTVNVVNVLVLVMLGEGRTSFSAILRSIFGNPILIGCLIGLAVNLSGVTLPAPVMQALDMMGRAALAVGILAVGAAMVLKRLFIVSWPIWATVALRQLLGPALFLAVAAAIEAMGGDVSTQAAVVGMIVFTVPPAANGYVFARQMGGDAELYADIMFWQTVVCILLLPVTVGLAQALF